MILATASPARRRDSRVPGRVLDSFHPAGNYRGLCRRRMNARQGLRFSFINGGWNMSKTLRGLLRELNIRIVPIAENHKRAARETCARATLARIFEQRGYDHLRTVLQTFVETPNKKALTGPVLWAVSDILKAYPGLFAGDKWFRIFDDVDLAGLFEVAKVNRRVSQPRQMIATMIFSEMLKHFPDQVRAGRRRRHEDEPAMAA
jgi:hypothetical protein